MTDVMNLNAETDRNIIGDDTTPTLTLENSSTGSALKVTNTGATTGVALSADVKATSAPTIAVISVTNSVASGAFFEFKGMLASIASAGSIVRGIRVKFGDAYGFIPVYASGTYI